MPHALIRISLSADACGVHPSLQGVCAHFHGHSHAGMQARLGGNAKNLERFTNLRVILAQGPC